MTPLSDPNEVAQGKAAVDAARQIPHVVFTYATNADRGTGIPHFDTKAEIERYLAAHHPHWTALGPALHAEFPEVGWHSYADWVSERRTSSATSGTR